MTVNGAISRLLERGWPTRSFEFFPPTDETGWGQFRATAEKIAAIEPDFVSITYGAGGSTRDRTDRAARILKDELGLLVMPHLTCVGAGRDEALQIARHFHAGGFRNIMALRGDPPKGEKAAVYRDGLRFGADLVELLRTNFSDLCIGVGGYPEKHPEAADEAADIQHLKAKVEKGADFVTTQLFFDNEFYFSFVERCRAAGIRAPIIPGVMPVLSYKQIRRFTEMCGASLPAALLKRLEAARDNTAKVEAIGIEWAAAQIVDLLNRGAPGYHLYVLNRARPAIALAEVLRGAISRAAQATPRAG